MLTPIAPAKQHEGMEFERRASSAMNSAPPSSDDILRTLSAILSFGSLRVFLWQIQPEINK